MILLFLLQIDRFEIDRIEQHGRKPGANRHIRHDLAQIRIKNVGADYRQHRLHFFRGNVAHLEYPRLFGLDQEQYFVLRGQLGGDGDGDGDIEQTFLYRRRLRVQLQIDLRILALQKDSRCIRHLQRHIFHIQLLDVKERLCVRLRVCLCCFSHGIFLNELLAQHYIQFARAIKRGHIVISAHMFAVDVYLRHGAAAGLLNHDIAHFRLQIDTYFLDVSDALAL